MPPLVRIMACRLFGDNPLSETRNDYCQLDHKEYISMKYCLKFNSFHWGKSIWNCRLQKWQPYCLVLKVLFCHQHDKHHYCRRYFTELQTLIQMIYFWNTNLDFVNWLPFHACALFTVPCNFLTCAAIPYGQGLHIADVRLAFGTSL